MSWSSWRVRAAVLIPVVVVTGAAAVHATPDGGHGIGLWPVGVASALLLLCPRRAALPLALVVGLVAALTIWQGGRSPEVALGYALGIAVETWVVWRILGRGRAEPPWRLRTESDLRRYVVGCFLGGGIGALAGLVTSAVTGFGDPAMVGLALLATQSASQLAITPLVARLPRYSAMAVPGERFAQWASVLVLAPVAFWPEDFPSLVFVLLLLLTWSALRLQPLEALAQMLALVVFAVVLTAYGRGPFGSAPESFGLPADVRGVLLGLFALTCALISVLLVLRVGQHIDASREARQERDMLQRIVRSATGPAIIGADHQGRVTLFNPGAERLLGWTAAEVMGQSTRMFHSDSAVSAKAAELGVPDDFGQVAQRLMEPDMEGADMGFLRKDGAERTFAMTLSRIVDERGQVTGFLSTSEDVTDRVETANALREALEQMREVDAVKDAFVSSVSHELRTPLTSIRGYLEMLQDGSYGDLSSAQHRAVGTVVGNSSRLLTLIDDLLVLSRVQEDGLHADGLGGTERVMDLGRVVTSGCEVVVPGLEVGRLELVVDVPPEPVPFLGEPHLLERVVINLVGNAVKFTPDGGRVEVRLHHRDEGSLLTVRDTGIGIPAAEQQHLFTRFFRSSLAQKRAIPGSGLGLSIAHAVVRRHGGAMSVSSEPGQGTTFSVELPAMV